MTGFDEPRPRLDGETLQLLRELFRGAFGLQLRDDLAFIAERRLWTRLEALELRDFAGYHRYLMHDARGKEELELAAELLVPHETYFFREPTQLESFRDEVLPELASRFAPGRRLSLWSAGCSSGEEAYTLAMLLDGSGLFPGWDVQVHGTDVSRRVLQLARAGEYGPSAVRAMPAGVLGRWFDRLDGGRYKVRDVLRTRVSFGHLNLMDATGVKLLPPMHAIFCRNVLIYLEPRARLEVVARFFERLVPGGLLFLGHSESLINESTAFELVQLEGDLAYRKP
ncbi:MAG: protein-glutamate O-methyltransferase CheR [Myxococcaceae bacterium]|nr:protein-glutamate O-methyltransferase CheR [Myxococcaceae bacterium]